MSEIDKKYQNTMHLGEPLHEERDIYNRKGRYRTYVNRGYLFYQPERDSSIYWSPETGAHVLQGGIRKQWIKLGSENGFLGLPTSDEIPFTEDGVIKNRFCNCCCHSIFNFGFGKTDNLLSVIRYPLPILD